MPEIECSSCRQTIQDTDTFCRHCGSTVTPSTVVCPSCNTELLRDSQFCSKCGSSIASPAVYIEIKAQSVISDTVLESQRPDNKSFCERCGHKLPEPNPPFCSQCGERVVPFLSEESLQGDPVGIPNPVPELDTYSDCAKCGKELGDTPYCIWCGESNLKDDLLQPILREQQKQNTAIIKNHRVSFPKAIKLGFQNYFNFRSRSTRGEFWWWMLFWFVPNYIVADPLVRNALHAYSETAYVSLVILWIAFNMATIVPTVAIIRRRLRDSYRTEFTCYGTFPPWPWIIRLMEPSSFKFNEYSPAQGRNNDYTE